MWRAVFLLTFKTNVCTKEYEVSRAQGIVLDFEFLRGCLGNKEGLSLEVCETLGNKKQNDSHLLHSITQLNQTPFQPAGMLLVCCESGGAALISMDSPPHSPPAVLWFWEQQNRHFFSGKWCLSRHPTSLQTLLPYSPQLPPSGSVPWKATELIMDGFKQN